MTVARQPVDARELFDAAVRLHPQAPAVVCGPATLSFAELAARARRLARRLAARGARPEVAVGVCLERGVDLVTAVLAVLETGAVLVPLDPEYPADRLSFMITDSAARLVVTQRGLTDRVTVSNVPVVPLDTLLAPPPQPRPHLPLADEPGLGSRAAANAAYLIYTSGSSGTPKAVTVAHASLVNLFFDYRDRLIDPAVRAAGGRRLRVAHTTSLSFDASWAALLWMLAGHELHIIERDTHDDPVAMLDYVDRHGIDVVDETPSYLRLLVRAGLLAENRRHPLVVTVGGEALDDALCAVLAEAPTTACHNSYGPTEFTVDALSWRVQPGRPPLIGWPVAGARPYLLDGALRPVPAGVAGELYLAGPGLARGYHGRPGLTAQRFLADPFGPAGSRMYRTGDLARRLDDGAFEFLGRADDQVQIYGLRVEPREVETALLRHPDVAQAAVVAAEHARGHRVLVGYVVARPSAAVTSGQLRRFLTTILPRPMVPAAFTILDRLPLTPNGKLDRHALPTARARAGQPRTVAPRNPTEELLARIWQDVLGVDRVGVRDEFVDLGGDSILAMRVVSELRRASGAVLSTRDLFTRGTVAELAELVPAGRHAEPPDQITALPRDGALPVSAAQQRLWFIDQFQPASVEYNTSSGLRLRGHLDVAALSTAMNALVARHEPLRTTFDTVDGQGVQLVGDPYEVTVEVLDVSGRTGADRQREADRLLEIELRRPFDLRGGPPLRVLLIRVAATEHLLVLLQHHLTTDGWSMGVLLEELGRLYSAALRGEPAALEPLGLQYADFAAWQRARVSAPAVQAQRAYWQRQLDGIVAVRLPTDRPRPAQRRSSGALHRCVIPAAVTARLVELGRAGGATLFMTLVAATQVLLARYSGQRDIALGTVTSGRNRAELERLVGFFVNTVVLRCDVDGALPFEDLLRRVRCTVLDAFTHDELPFHQVVAAVRPERDTSHSPLVQVMLVLQNAPAQPLRMAGLEVAEIDLPGVGAQFDLTVEFALRHGALAVTIDYDTDLFDASTIERMAGHLRQLLAGIAADPRCRVAGLPLLSPAEHQRLRLGKGPAGDVAARHDPPRHTVPELFAEQVGRRPDATALTCQGADLSYRELDAEAERLADALVLRGVGPDVVVGVFLDRGPALVVALLAVLKASGAYLPLDPQYPAERLAFMLTDAAAGLVLTERALRDRLPEHAASVLCLDGAAAATGRVTRTAAGPRNLAYVMYTSGSTGAPKAIMIEHRSVVGLCRAPELRPGHSDVVAQSASVSFDAATFEIWASLLGGARLVICPPGVPTAPELGTLLAEGGVTTLWLTAGLFQEMVDSDLEALAGLRRLIAGGDVLSPSHCARVLRELPHLELFNGYGPTEGTTFATCHRLDPHHAAATVPIGSPIAGTRCYVVDPDLNLVPAGVPGELLLGGHGLARGYLNRPGLTAQRFVANPFGPAGSRLYRTGDVVRWRSGQEVLEFIGRLDDQVKIRGFRVELGEVEAALRQHPGVTEAVVTARADAGHQQLVAYVVAGHPAPDGPAVRSFLQQRLPGYLVPSAFVMLDRIPLTPSGKVDRAALPAPSPGRGPRHVPARTPVERTLCQVWSQVLGVDRVGVEDNFFDLGGDSILSIQVVSRAREHGLRLSSRDIFMRQTISQLATVAAPAPAPACGSEDALVAGPVPLTPIQHWFFEHVTAHPEHFNQWVMAELADGVEPDRLRGALRVVLDGHDALRLRFARVAGQWRQHLAGTGDGGVVDCVDLRALDGPDQEAALSAAIGRAQTGLRLDTGPLARAVVFLLGPGRRSRLLLTVHHLAVDAVSWRILLDDLHLAYRQATAGEAVRPPARTTSLRDWARRLGDHTAAGGFDHELAYWARVCARVPAARPGRPERPARPARPVNGADTGADRCVAVRLGAERTAALLHTVPAAYRTQVNDVLLSALGRVLSRWTGQPRVAITLEGHGREDVLPGGEVDLSRTVGWFTTTFPVTLDIPDRGGWGAVLKSVKEQLREVPHRGIGYGALRYLGSPQARRQLRGPQPTVSFNYLGQFDPGGAAGELLHRPPERIGLDQRAGGERGPQLDISAVVAAGELELTWYFGAGSHSEASHDEGAVRGLAEDMLAALGEIIEHCAQPGSGGATPSDFPLAGLDQAAVDRLVGCGRAVRDAYPLTAMQAGMLFHALAQPDSGLYLEQVHLALEAAVDLPALGRAWQRAVDAIPHLRTCLAWTQLPRPLQVVRERATVPVSYLDWTGLPPGAAAERLRQFLDADRAAGIDLTAAPLMRLALIRLPDAAVRVVWTFHHVLLDGWSVFQVLTDVLARYNDPGAEPAGRPPFRDYLAWLAEQDPARAQRHWHRLLAGQRSATRLPVDRPPAQTPQGQTHRTRASAVADAELSRADSARLFEFARSQRLTLSAIVQGMWALLLSRHSGEREVCFGVTVSGRPADLPGVESMVGMFINTVPVRVRIDPDDELVPWLRALQAQRVESERFDHVPLTMIRSCSAVPAGQSLFDSIVVFENYPLDRDALTTRGLTVTEVDAVEITNYPLNVVAAAADELTLRLVYDPDLFDAGTAAGLVEQLATLLAQVSGKGRSGALYHSRPLTCANTWCNAPADLGRLPAPPATSADAQRARRATEVTADPPAPVRGPVSYVAPRTSTERVLAQIWTELLRVERVGVEDDFFVLGGDSILSIRVASRVQAMLGVELSPRALFDHPTVAALARAIQDAPDGPDGSPEDAAPATDGDRLPLSPGQQRLWFLHNLAPDSAEYNSALPLRLVGELDPAALTAALGTVLARHEVLRTTFADGPDGGGAQIVHPPGPVRMPMVNLADLPEARRRAELHRRLLRELGRPFDLRRGPVLRALLLRVADREHVLHLVMHHIVTDGWSMAVLLRELTGGYRAALAGIAPDLPRLTVRYADVARWQRRRAHSPAGAADLAYWRRRLDGMPLLELPTDRPRPVIGTSAGACERFTLAAEPTARLREFGDRHGTTLFTTLVAAIQVILARHTGQHDIAVGTVVAGRDRAELEQLIGCFVNIVVLRAEVDEELSFAGHLARVRERVLEAFVHAQAPFQQVVEALAPRRDTAGTPLVRVMVSFQNFPEVAADLAGLRVEPIQLTAPLTQFDLSVEIHESHGALEAALSYSADLFDRATIARLAEHLVALLRAVASQPDAPLRQLAPATQPRDASRSARPAATGPSRRDGHTVLDLFERGVAEHPDAAAVRAGGQQLTYGELDDRARVLAGRLVAHGVRRGERVLVVLAPGLPAVVTFVALARIGAVAIGLEPDVPASRLRHIVDSSAAVLVLTEHTVLPDAVATSGTGPRPDDALCCVYTSGSTSRPKGVVLTHRNLLALVSWHGRAFDGTVGERCGQVANLGFDASVWELWSALCLGRCLCVADPAARRDPRALGRWVAREELVWCFLPTAVGQRLIAEGVLASATRLRHVVLGGETLTQLPAQDTPFTLVNAYGPTEATVCATWFDTTGWRRGGRAAFAAPPIGRPLEHVQAHILDRYLRPVPVGVVGELYLGGEGVARGYLDAPGYTAQRFVADPFAAEPGRRLYRTGDLARRGADGLIEFRGRADRQVKIGGMRVELDEIEHLLRRHDEVAEAAVVTSGGPQVAAYVTAARPTLEVGALRGWLREHLPQTLLPSRITVLDTLPLTTTGKIDRLALARRAESAELAASAPACGQPPRTDTERAVARLWGELLGRVSIDVREKFFDAGGSSLMLMDLRGRLEQLCARQIPMALLFEHSTVEAMARLVDQRVDQRPGAGAGVEHRYQL